MIYTERENSNMDKLWEQRFFLGRILYKILNFNIGEKLYQTGEEIIKTFQLIMIILTWCHILICYKSIIKRLTREVEINNYSKMQHYSKLQ